MADMDLLGRFRYAQAAGVIGNLAKEPGSSSKTRIP
jgi:hypothetical protein